MTDFIVTLTDAQVAAFQYLAAAAKTDVRSYLQRLASDTANNVNNNIDARVSSLGMDDPVKEARVRSILVEA